MNDKPFSLIESIRFLDAARQAEYTLHQARLKKFREALLSSPEAKDGKARGMMELYLRWLKVPADG